MPTYQIDTPDGKSYSVEAADVNAAMAAIGMQDNGARAQSNPFEGMSEDQARTAIGQMPADQRDNAMNTWADAVVSKERQNGGIGQAIDNGIRGIARGTPVGSWLDEGNAVLSGAGSALTGGSFSQGYDESVAYQRAKDRAFDTANPVTSTGLQLAGGVASAVAAAPAVLGSMGGAAPALGTQIVNGAKAGALAGGIYGAGLGENTLGNRAWEGAKGAAIGGGIGAVAPAVISGAGKVVEAVANSRKPIPQALAGFAPGATKRMASIAANSKITRPGVDDSIAALGPDAMVADLARPLEDTAGAIAATQTRGGQTIFEAIKGRGAGASGRVGAAVDRALGAAQNVPKLIEKISSTFKGPKDAAYKAFRNTPVPYTREIESVINSLKNEPGVLTQARRYANLEEGIGASGPRQFFADIASDGTVTINRVPNATEYDYIKRALDDLARGNPNDKRLYGSYAKSLRETVDAALSPEDPTKSIWRQARSLASDEFELKDALEAGRDAFKRNISADEMQAELANLSEPAQAAYRVGARQAVRDTMENSATKFGENADSAGMRLLGSQSARAKVDVINPGASQKLGQALDAEGRFAATEQNVLQNSRTAARQSAQQSLPRGAIAGDVKGVGRDTTLVGITANAVYSVVNALRSGALKSNAETVVGDMARMLTTQGVPAGKIVKALLDYNDSLANSKMGAESIKRLVGYIAKGAQQATIAGASGGEPRLRVNINRPGG